MFLCGACTCEITLLVQQLQLRSQVPRGLHLPPILCSDTISPQLHRGYHVPSPNQTHTGWWKTRGACEFSKRKSNEPCNITDVQYAHSCRSCPMYVVLRLGNIAQNQPNFKTIYTQHRINFVLHKKTTRDLPSTTYPPSSEKYVPASESPSKHWVTPKVSATEDSHCPSSWRFFKQPVKLYAEFLWRDTHGDT